MLQDKIENLLASIDEKIDGAGKKETIGISMISADPLLTANVDEVRDAVQSHLDGKCPGHINTVSIDGHRRIEIAMRLRQN